MGGMSVPGMWHDLCDTHRHALMHRGHQRGTAVGQKTIGDYFILYTRYPAHVYRTIIWQISVCDSVCL